MRQLFNSYRLPLDFSPQYRQNQPDIDYIMHTRSISESPFPKGTGKKLLNKVAIITGGDSEIGRAVAYAFAKEGADICIVYLNTHVDVGETRARIEDLGRRCITIATDIRIEKHCQHIVKNVMERFGKLDILVNNARVIYPSERLENISKEQLEHTFGINVFSYFYFTKAAIRYMKLGASIINSTYISVFRSFDTSLDYDASKAAIAGFTKSLSKNLIPRGIRVNNVANGQTWTPLIPVDYVPEEFALWGTDTPMGRGAQLFEIVPAFVFLASDDSSYMTGQTIQVFG